MTEERERARTGISSLRVRFNRVFGYGIEVKLNTGGVVRDNVIIDTKGPGIMVYGARDLVTVSVVERNFTRGSRTSSRRGW